jgi:hypothetical protein
MARRPAADKNPPDLPLTLHKAFEACLTAAGESAETADPRKPVLESACASCASKRTSAFARWLPSVVSDQYAQHD